MGVFGTFFQKSKSGVTTSNDTGNSVPNSNASATPVSELNSKEQEKVITKKSPTKSAMQAYFEAQQQASQGANEISNRSDFPQVTKSTLTADNPAMTKSPNHDSHVIGTKEDLIDHQINQQDHALTQITPPTDITSSTLPTAYAGQDLEADLVIPLNNEASNLADANQTEPSSQAQPVVIDGRSNSFENQIDSTIPEVSINSKTDNLESKPGWTASMDRKEVVTAYKIFLRRFPESPDVIEPRVGMPRERLLSSFIMSPEHLQHPDHIKLIFDVANQMIAERQANEGNKS